MRFLLTTLAQGLQSRWKGTVAMTARCCVCARCFSVLLLVLPPLLPSFLESFLPSFTFKPSHLPSSTPSFPSLLTRMRPPCTAFLLVFPSRKVSGLCLRCSNDGLEINPKQNHSHHRWISESWQQSHQKPGESPCGCGSSGDRLVRYGPLSSYAPVMLHVRYGSLSADVPDMLHFLSGAVCCLHTPWYASCPERSAICLSPP